MERTEPALVPEWLRCTGNVAGSGASTHHSDVSSPSHYTRSRSFRSNHDKDSPRQLDRSSSSSSRRCSSSNGSAKHPYSSFSRSHRDKNRDREKRRSLFDDSWDQDLSDPLASIVTSRVENSARRHSQSLVSRKPGEKFAQKLEDSQISGNGALPGGSKTTVLKMDFPSLRTEEKQGVTGIRRVLSPGLTSAVKSLPIGNSEILSGEKWTSALAEVPAALANNGTAHSPSFQHSVGAFSNPTSGVSSMAGLNMAEALSQPAARVHTTTELPDRSQKLEELAIKQSRQLIPVTPSMPKPLVSGSVDKSKQPKAAVRTNEMNMASRVVHLQSHSANLSNQSRVVQIRSDCASSSHVGKFLVLRPGRESTALGVKDASSSTGDADGKLDNCQHAMAPSTPTALKNLSTPVVPALEKKAATLSLSSKSTVDKRSSQSLAQSRSAFFNLMRRKTSSCATNIQKNSSLNVPSPSAQTSGEQFEGGNADMSPCVLENGHQIICNSDRCNIPEKIKSFSDVGDDSFSGNGSIYPDEEEAAFLRSLGWEENGGEDEGLTEEEISAFYREYMNRRPSVEVRRCLQPKFSTPTKSPNTNSGIASSDSSSTESE